MNKKIQYPIVLAHGIARFDYLTHSILKKINLFFCKRSFSFDNLHYFRGISSFLRKNGYMTYNTSVTFAADVRTRAADLREEIARILDQSGSKKVHIIAHSMGGLDARCMIGNFEDMADKVATLTTIGTPHLGTIFADWGIQNGFDKFIKFIERIIDLKGYANLSTEACMKFNKNLEKVEAANSVIYQTISCRQEKDSIFLPFQKSWDIIFKGEGENDGLVSVKSQKWTEKLSGDNGVVKKIIQKEFPIPADHFNSVGWWNMNQFERTGWWNLRNLKKMRTYEDEVKAAYLKIVEELGQFC